MELSLETITIFIFLIPGFISLIFTNALIVRKEIDRLAPGNLISYVVQ